MWLMNKKGLATKNRQTFSVKPGTRNCTKLIYVRDFSFSIVISFLKVPTFQLT